MTAAKISALQDDEYVRARGQQSGESPVWFGANRYEAACGKMIDTQQRGVILDRELAN